MDAIAQSEAVFKRLSPTERAAYDMGYTRALMDTLKAVRQMPPQVDRVDVTLALSRLQDERERSR